MVGSSALGLRIFVNAKDGFTLASVGVGQQAIYPAASLDGGRRWHIDGPQLWVSAADAPAYVSQMGAASAKLAFAWGGPGSGGQVVDASADGGKHWYQAALGDELEAVVAGSKKGELLAFAQALTGSGTAATTWVYLSKDGGRVWHYSSSLAGGG